MTLVVLIVIAAGVLLVTSALDNTSIVQAFQDILAGNHINTSGTNATQSSSMVPTSGSGGNTSTF